MLNDSEANLFPACGSDFDRFRIYNEKHIQSLMDDEMETERLISDGSVIDQPLKPKK